MFDLDGSTQSKPKQGFCFVELTATNEISLLDPYERALGKCCVDPLRPPRLAGLGLGETGSYRSLLKFYVGESIGEARIRALSIISTWRIPLWPVSEWECRGRRPSRA
jgi:hypothetical protein